MIRTIQFDDAESVLMPLKTTAKIREACARAADNQWDTDIWDRIESMYEAAISAAPSPPACEVGDARDGWAAIALLTRMRFACGDNGARMQDELEVYLRELALNAGRWEKLCELLEEDAEFLTIGWSKDSDGRYRAITAHDRASLNRFIDTTRGEG